jgi:Ca-activated chloride channel family protein
MKITHVVALAIVGMMASSATVYGVTPPATAPRALRSEVDGSSAAMAGDVLARRRFGGGTVEVDARLAHGTVGPGDTTHLLLEVRGGARTPAVAAPVAVALVLDRSGSMAGARLERAIEAASGMVARLRDGDVVTVLAFDTSTVVAVPPTALSATSRLDVLAALGRIAPGGDTCVSCGMEDALARLAPFADRPRHVLVLSDGKTNHGMRDLGGLTGLAEASRARGVSISTVGVGADYDARVLGAIAASSNGRHHFADTAASLPALFDAEAAALATTVAADVRADIELGSGVELVRVLDRGHRPSASGLAVELGTLARDETKTVLVELRVRDGAPGPRAVATVRLRFDDLVERQGSGVEATLGVVVGRESGEVDPVVLERLERSRTSAALEEANDLLAAGNVAEATARLEAQERAIAAASKSAGGGAGFDRQLRSTTRARNDLRPKPKSGAGGCGCSGGDLQCQMRCGANESEKDAFDLRR